jgi:hypothetical protein
MIHIVYLKEIHKSISFYIKTSNVIDDIRVNRIHLILIESIIKNNLNPKRFQKVL